MIVVLESPERNVAYARRCLRDSLMRDEAPIASHLLYTQPGVLDDNDPHERLLGVNRGHAYLLVADLVAVYTDLGISPGMQTGIQRASMIGLRVDFRQIGGE